MRKHWNGTGDESDVRPGYAENLSTTPQSACRVYVQRRFVSCVFIGPGGGSSLRRASYAISPPSLDRLALAWEIALAWIEFAHARIRSPTFFALSELGYSKPG